MTDLIAVSASDRLQKEKREYALRTLSEHRRLASRWDDLYRLLINFDFLEDKCKFLSVYDLESDYQTSLHEWHGTSDHKYVLEKFEERLRLESHSINKSPELLFPNLYNHLTWLDAPDGPFHVLCEDAKSKRVDWLRLVRVPHLEASSQSPAFHLELVRSVTVLPDGELIASGSDDTTIKLWQLKNGRMVRSLTGHTGLVRSVAVTPDGTQIVSGSDDQTVKIWDVSTGRLERSLQGGSWVNSVIVTPDGTQIVSGSEDKTLMVWELKTGRPVFSMNGHVKEVKAVATTPDGAHVVSGAADNTIIVWDLKTGQLVRILKGHTGPVKSVAVTPNGIYIISGSEDRTVRVWELATGRLVRSLEDPMQFGSGVQGVAITPDGKHAVSCKGLPAAINVWHLPTGRLVRQMDVGGSVMSVAVTPDGTHVVSGSDDIKIGVWELTTGRLVRSLGNPSDE